MVALHELEAEGAADLGFGGIFDPFGERSDAELTAHADQRFDELASAGVGLVEAGDHLAVKFHEVGPSFDQLVKPCLAGAEIVRRRQSIPGDPFSLGFFVGDTSTPNSIKNENPKPHQVISS